MSEWIAQIVCYSIYIGPVVGNVSEKWERREIMFKNMVKFIVQGPLNTFFLENAFKKKLLNIFSNFLFYLKVQSFRLIMENNFIQMAASPGHAVAYTICPIFKHIIDCVQLYFTNNFTNILL